MKKQSESVQQLQIAEKKAEEKINQARKHKALRLKQAKEEAQAEIESFRSEKEQKFRTFDTKFMDNYENTALKINEETEKALEEIEKLVKCNKDLVIESLLDNVFSIFCEVHQNFQSEF